MRCASVETRFPAPRGCCRVRTVLIDYGAGNLHSVAKALVTAGLSVSFVRTPEEAEGAEVAVLPGQGHFGQVAHRFAASGFEPWLRTHIDRGRPFLGICVGLQLLMDGSDEAPDVSGLGILPGWVRRFPEAGPSVPHMGWNTVHRVGDAPLLQGLPDGSHAYFAHSYYVDFAREDGWTGGSTRYGDVTMLSAVSRGAVHATQFHPEKSQRFGLRLLARFAEEARRVVETP